MTDLVPIECEARLMGLSKTRRKDGDWFEAKFHIHPDDMTRLSALFLLPLGTACNLAIKGVTETPTASTNAPTETARPKGGERAKRAGILCNDPAFQRWWVGKLALGNNPTLVTAEALREKCSINSRADLDHNEEAARIFDDIVAAFYASQRGETDDAYQAMARDGR